MTDYPLTRTDAKALRRAEDADDLEAEEYSAMVVALLADPYAYATLGYEGSTNTSPTLPEHVIQQRKG